MALTIWLAGATEGIALGQTLSASDSVAASPPPTASPELEPCAAARSHKRSPVYRGDDGWYFFKHHLHAVVTDSAVRTQFRRLNDALARLGVVLVVIPIPERGMVQGRSLAPGVMESVAGSFSFVGDSYRKFVRSLRAEGVRVADVLEPALELVGSGGRFFRKLDAHWIPEGARVAADAIAAELGAVGDVYRSMPKSKFASERVGVAPAEGSIERSLESLCNVDIPREEVSRFRVAKLEKSEPELFDEPSLDVVLVGTSLSAPLLNSADSDFGFLHAATGIDIFDAHVSGGGLFTAIERYVLDPEFAEHKPKLLLWEFPVLAVNARKVSAGFRQLIPSVFGVCSGESIAAVGEKVSLAVSAANASRLSQPVSIGLLRVDEGRHMAGSGHYLQIELSDRALLDFELVFHFSDGSREHLAVSRSARVTNVGKFFAEFDAGAELTGVDLRLAKPSNGTAAVTICRSPSDR